MDLLKEILITFSSKKKREFEKFLVRKRPSEDRKDITILNALFQYYNSPKKEFSSKRNAKIPCNQKAIN